MKAEDLKKNKLYIVKSKFDYLNNIIIEVHEKNQNTLYYKVVKETEKSRDTFYSEKLVNKMDYQSPNALQSNFIELGNKEKFPEYFI